MSATIAEWRQKIKKTLDKNALKQSRKMKLKSIVTRSLMTFKKLREMKIFKQLYIRPQVPVDIISLFLISDFPAESLKANKNWRKTLLILQYGFAQKTSIILLTSTHSTMIKVCSRNAAKKPLSVKKFSNKYLVCVKKKRHLHCTVFRYPRNAFLKCFERKSLHISIYLYNRIFAPETC